MATDKQPDTAARAKAIERLLLKFVEVSTVWSAAGGDRLGFCKLCEEGLHVADRPCACPCHESRKLLGDAVDGTTRVGN